MERLFATYQIETPLEVAEAAAMLAGEQSCGTFIKIPGETDALKERFAARVESITEQESVTEPSLPGGKPSPDGRFRRAEIVVSWPLENFGANFESKTHRDLGHDGGVFFWEILKQRRYP